MKTIQIVSKASANKILVNSLFNPVNGKTLNKMRWCTGKYKPGSFPVGKNVDVAETTHAVWSESRSDSDGPYTALFCICE